MAETPRTVTVCLFGVLLLDFGYCSNCRVYHWKVWQAGEKDGWYCRSCKRDLTREITPNEMDYEDQEHAESIDPGLYANGRAQLRGADWSGSARASAGRATHTDAVRSSPGAPGDHERSDAGQSAGAGAGAARARQFTDTQ